MRRLTCCASVETSVGCERTAELSRKLIAEITAWGDGWGGGRDGWGGGHIVSRVACLLIDRFTL